MEIGGLVAPSRYPFGYPLLAAPLVRLAAGAGAPQPEAAVLASALAGAVLVGAIALTGWRAFGGACGPGGQVAAVAASGGRC